MPVPTTQGVHRRELLRDNVYASIRDAIVDGTLAPDERLRDSDLEAWLGVSRTPIREALLRLERAGLVRARPGHSTIVAPVDEAATRNAQQVAATLHGLAVRLAVPLLDEGHLAAMREANDRFSAALEAEDVAAALAADDDFHEVAVLASGNPVIATMLEQVAPVLRRVERMRFGSLSGRESVDQHAAVIDACVRRDADAAADAAQANWHTLGALLDG